MPLLGCPTGVLIPYFVGVFVCVCVFCTCVSVRLSDPVEASILIGIKLDGQTFHLMFQF